MASLLGHADLATTMGYAHLAEATIAEAAGRVARQINDALIPTEPVTPVMPHAPRPKKPKRPRQPRAHKPTLPPEPPLPEPDRPWVRYIEAFHKSPLRLDAFCADQGLDPKQMGQALARHFKRRKELVARAG